jgi:HEAT repeat protein
MDNALRRLPSLDAVMGFDAAARHLSFTRAADELSLTQSAISRQVQTLEDEETLQHRTFHGQEKKGVAALPALMEAMRKDKEPQVRAAALEAVGQVAGRQAVAPAQRALVEEKDERVRAAAAAALASAGAQAAAAQGALEEALIKDTNAAVRASAAEALVGLGARAVSSLVKGLREGSADSKRLSADALGRLKLTPPEVIAGLLAALADDSAVVRLAAVRSVGSIGPKAQRAVLPLQGLLAKDIDEAVREAAATSLGQLGPRATVAVRALATAAESDPSLAVRKAARQTLQKLR